MDRKWRTNRAALCTVVPYQEFDVQLPQRDAPYTLADTTDLYAVYTVLHIDGKESQLQWSPQGSFYYFIAMQQLRQDGEAAQQPVVPEGDEDILQVLAVLHGHRWPALTLRGQAWHRCARSYVRLSKGSSQSGRLC